MLSESSHVIVFLLELFPLLGVIPGEADHAFDSLAELLKHGFLHEGRDFLGLLLDKFWTLFFELLGQAHNVLVDEGLTALNGGELWAFGRHRFGLFGGAGGAAGMHCFESGASVSLDLDMVLRLQAEVCDEVEGAARARSSCAT